MTRPIRFPVALSLVGLLVPGTAHAHLVSSGMGPFYDGLLHLLLTPEDLLPALAVMLLAGQHGVSTGRTTLFALPLAWLVGALLGPLGPGFELPPGVATLPLLLVAVLVATEAPLGAPSLVGLVSALGVFHGALNGVTAARAGSLGLLGMLTGLFILSTLVIALVLATRPSWGRIAVRVAGSWLLAVGLLSVGWSLRGGLT